MFDNNNSITVVKNITIINNAGNYNGKRFRSGPTRAEFERNSNRKLEVVSVRDNAKPGRADVRGNEVRVYRPKVNNADRSTARPSKVVPLEKMKRADGGKAREADKKVAPLQKNNIREKQQENKQPQMQKQKTEVKQQPKGQERKSEMNQRSNEQVKNTQIQNDKNRQVKTSAPEQKNNVREKQQPKEQERKPEMNQRSNE